MQNQNMTTIMDTAIEDMTDWSVRDIEFVRHMAKTFVGFWLEDMDGNERYVATVRL